MKETTVNQLNKMKTLTAGACRKDGFGCCSKFFCKVSELEMKALGHHVEKTDNKDIPYLGPNGCVIPPEYRPGCSMYACPIHLKDRKFRREWERSRQKILADPVIAKAMRDSTAEIKALIEDPDAMGEYIDEFQHGTGDLGI